MKPGIAIVVFMGIAIGLFMLANPPKIIVATNPPPKPIVVGPPKPMPAPAPAPEPVDPNIMTLTRQFTERNGRSHSVTFNIRRNELDASIKAYGYSVDDEQSAIEKVVQGKAEDFNNAHADASVNFTAYRDSNRILQWGKSTSQGKTQEGIDAIREFWKDLEATYQSFRTSYEKSHGFALITAPGTKRMASNPDWPAIEGQNIGPLSDLSTALEAGAGNGNREAYLEQTLAFCQEIPYKIPPTILDGKILGGFVPPLQQIVQNWGDCDCKSVLFASLWSRKYPQDSVLVLIPTHMFVAVKGRPRFSTDHSIEYKGATYICVEPVGPGKALPGFVWDFSIDALNKGNYEVLELPST